MRAYIVALQGLRARELHPAQPTENRPLSDATINSYVRALRAFSSWLYEEGYTEAPALARLKAPRMTQKTQPILTEAEIAAIACALNPRTEIGARDQAIFLLLLDTGMRAGELCGLRLPQLHLDEGYAIVLGKGRKERPIKIGARTAKAIRFYLLHWRTPALAHEASCARVRGGEPLSVSALEQLIKRIGQQIPRAGVGHKLLRYQIDRQGAQVWPVLRPTGRRLRERARGDPLAGGTANVQRLVLSDLQLDGRQILDLTLLACDDRRCLTAV